MADTFFALLLAHLIADFVLLPTGMAAQKKRLPVFMLHIAIVLAVTVFALGGNLQLALLIAGAHLVLDALKTWVFPDTLTAFLSEQLALIAVAFLVAANVPDAFANGIWGGSASLFRDGVIITCGLLGSTLAGGPAVGALLKAYTSSQIEPGLTNAGRIIGILERGLIFLMVMTGQLAGIGFLIAAKSVLRFDTASKDQKNSEYVIIGTLASFGWAMLVAFTVLAARP